MVTWSNGEASWNFPGNKYRTTEVWRKIRTKKDKVGWHKLIWARFVVPKPAVIAWMVVQNRLPTKDRLKCWGMEMNGECELCRDADETRDHLFYDCNFSQQLWNEVLSLCGQSRRVTSWQGELQWAIQRLRGKSLMTEILRVAWHTVIYFIWQERNNRFHKSKVKAVMHILEKIKEVVRIRIRLMGMKKVKINSVNFSLYRSWQLSQTIFV